MLRVKKSNLKGKLTVPGSKSHTIRSFLFAALADGVSEIENTLLSADTKSCLEAVRVLGAKVQSESGNKVIIEGFKGKPSFIDSFIDVGNSGTTLRLLLSAAALHSEKIIFDGDSSIRKRPLAPLLQALKDLGAAAGSDTGACPCFVKGPLKGGRVEIDGTTSQYLSSLLITTPLLDLDSEIIPVNLNEKPYVRITLKWLDEMGIQYECDDNLNRFFIPGRQSYHSFHKFIPSDFSTACFGLCASLVTGSELTLKGLDFSDTQGDKKIFRFAEKMGAEIKVQGLETVINPLTLRGGRFDLNETPDALPVMAVLGCFADGETVLYNVRQARIKECDRIKVMASELGKMGADITEKEDGLIIRPSKLNGTSVEGYDDHRVVMALACAGLNAEGETLISTPDAYKVTYPDFYEDFIQIGASLAMT